MLLLFLGRGGDYILLYSTIVLQYQPAGIICTVLYPPFVIIIIKYNYIGTLDYTARYTSLVGCPSPETSETLTSARTWICHTIQPHKMAMMSEEMFATGVNAIALVCFGFFIRYLLGVLENSRNESEREEKEAEEKAAKEKAAKKAS